MQSKLLVCNNKDLFWFVVSSLPSFRHQYCHTTFLAWIPLLIRFVLQIEITSYSHLHIIILAQVSSMEMSEEMEVGSNAGMNNPDGQQQQQHQGVGTQEEMEAPSNPAYRQYLADRAEEERRAAGEMMPTSMMAHCILPTNQQQHQMLLYQQLGMVQQHQHQHQHQQAGNLQLAQQLGGSSLISSQPDLVPVLSSLHLV